jgi:hypothetical protein
VQNQSAFKTAQARAKKALGSAASCYAQQQAETNKETGNTVAQSTLQVLTIR